MGPRLPWSGWDAVEPGLAMLLFVIEAAVRVRIGHPLLLLVPVVLCGGAAASGRRPRPGAVVTCLAIAASVLMGDHWSAAIYAPLVCILGCLLAGARAEAAVTTLWSWAWLAGWTARRSRTPGEQVLTIVVWAVLFAMPWLLALGFGRRHQQQRQAMLDDLEAQRLTIAAELHDTLAHDLAVITMGVETALIRHPDSPDADTLRTVGDTARRSAGQLRHLVELLRVGPVTEVLDLAAVLDETRATLGAAGHHVVAEAGAAAALDTATGDLLARVLREAAHNVVRHAVPGTPCRITVERGEGVVALAVTSATDGPRAWSPGVGITGITRRVHARNGTVDIDDRDGTWVLRVTVPAWTAPGPGQRPVAGSG